MNRLIRPVLAVLLLVSAVATARAEAAKAPIAKLDLQDGDCIVFLGDSITHQCLYTQYVEDYFYTRYPKMRLKLHNAGVGGAKAWDALARFDADVAAYKPKYVTILLGMNDGQYQPYNETIFQTYHTDMTELVGRLTATGAQPIPMTPTMFDSRAARAQAKRKHDPGKLELYNSVLAYYGTWLREVAVESGFGFVDMYGPLNTITLAQRKTDPNFTLIRDAVHPNEPGQVVMATAIINDLGLSRSVSLIRITPDAKGKAHPIARGGKLTDLSYSDDHVEFTFLADSLPWVVPEEAQLGADLTKLGHKLSGEKLEVQGLKPGQYELSIDGVAVGRYSASALGRHIELQRNAKTPQYQQALNVALLNRDRNQKAVRPMRGEWSQFQRFARDRRTLEGDPKNEPLAKRVAAAAEKMETIGERVKVHEAAAKAIEDEIFKVNQPKPRRYVLKRVVAGKKPVK